MKQKATVQTPGLNINNRRVMLPVLLSIRTNRAYNVGYHSVFELALTINREALI